MTALDYDAHRAGVAQCADLLARAVLTLQALPSRDLLDFRNGWPDIVREARDAYGYTEARMKRFRPTPYDVSVVLDVVGWLTWLERNGGKRDAKVIVWRAKGVPWWIIADRMGRETRTIRRWHDGGVTRIYAKFRNQVKAK